MTFQALLRLFCHTFRLDSGMTLHPSRRVKTQVPKSIMVGEENFWWANQLSSWCSCVVEFLAFFVVRFEMYLRYDQWSPLVNLVWVLVLHDLSKRWNGTLLAWILYVFLRFGMFFIIPDSTIGLVNHWTWNCNIFGFTWEPNCWRFLAKNASDQKNDLFMCFHVFSCIAHKWGGASFDSTRAFVLQHILMIRFRWVFFHVKSTNLSWEFPEFRVGLRHHITIIWMKIRK